MYGTVSELLRTGRSEGAIPRVNFAWASILIVDDDEGNRQALARSIARFGSQVRQAADGPTAIEALETWRTDLVLLDIFMPGMDGFQVLERMRAQERMQDIMVIMISAADDMDSIARAIGLGAADYLPKPCPPEILRARIGGSLERMSLRNLSTAGSAEGRGPGTTPVAEPRASAPARDDASRLERLRDLAEATVRYANLAAAELPETSSARSYLSEIERAGREASAIAGELGK